MEKEEKLLEQMQREKEELKAKSLFILRVIGKDVGVKSPTSMRKDALIEDIIAIKYLGKTPHYATTGRKGKLDVDSFIDTAKKISADGKKSISEEEAEALRLSVPKVTAQIASKLPRTMFDMMKKQLKANINDEIDKIFENYLMREI